MNEYQRLLHHHLGWGRGLARRGRVSWRAQACLGQGKALGLLLGVWHLWVCPFHLPLPCTGAQPHLRSPSSGPKPSEATLQSDTSLSDKLPDQPSWALRIGICQSRNQPQTCRQPHRLLSGGWCWGPAPREATGTLGSLTLIKPHKAAIQASQQ